MKKTLLTLFAVVAMTASAQISLTEGWNYSLATSVPSFLQEDGTNLFRNMTYNDGKIYVLYSGGAAKNHIKILDAYTGSYKGELSLEGVNTGYFYVSGITTLGGKVFACNCLINASGGTLKIYSWDNDDATPKVVLEDATINGTIGQLGAQLDSYGNLTNGKFIINNHTTTKIAYYNVTDGVVDTTPTVIDLKATDGTTEWSGNGSRGSSGVTFNEDGTFWVVGKDKAPTLFSADGIAQSTVKSGALNGNTYGTDIEFIKYQERDYAIASCYYTTARDGAFTIFDVTDGVSNADSFEQICPIEGLGGTTNNSAWITKVECATRNEGKELDIWLLVNGEGVVYYSSDKLVSVEETMADANAPVEYYNLQGVKVDNPEKGIFIKKQGSKTTKIVR